MAINKSRLLYIGLFLFCLAVVYSLAQYAVYEAGEMFFPLFFSGVITQGLPVNIWYFVSHFILAEVYMKLYSSFPGIPWYETVMYFYVSVSLFSILYILFKNNAERGVGVKVFIGLLSLILATEFIFFFQYTRGAFALGIAATLTLLHGNKISKNLRWWAAVLFVFCLLTRHEVGIFVFMFQWLVVLFIANKNYSKAVLWFNTVILFLIAGYMAYDRFTTTDFLKQFEPELGYQLLDRGNIVPLGSMKNAVDSAKYIAVTNLITDKEYTTIPFLRSLVAENAFVGVNKALILRAIGEMTDKLDHSLGLLIIYIGLFIIVLQQKLRQGRVAAAKFLAFNLSFWAILFAVAYFIILQYYNVDVMLTMMCFILLSIIDFEAARSYPVVILSGLLFVSGTKVLYHKQQEYSNRLSANIAANIEFNEEVKKRYAGKIIVPGCDQGELVLFCLRPFQLHNFTMFKRFYLFDSDVVYIEPHYNAYLSKECNCDAGNYTAFMDFMESKKEDVRIISSAERINIIKYYCRVVRGKDYNIVPIDTVSIAGNSATVFTFK